MRRVCVFCGSRDGVRPQYREAALALGRALGSRGLGLVYGGAQNGLMGAVADAVLEAGQPVIGVIPHGLARTEFAHPRLTEVHFVDSMAQRKALMGQLADAFVALPGGFGTLDELFEVLTEAQLGIHHKPIGLVDTHGYFGPLLQWVTQALSEGFVPAELRGVLVVDPEPDRLIERLLQHVPPPIPVRWITRSP